MFMGFIKRTRPYTALPFTREDYFALVDETSRCIRDDKRSFIAKSTPLLLSQFGIDMNFWLSHVKRFGDSYGYYAGSRENILNYTEVFSRKTAKRSGASCLHVYKIGAL